MWRGTFIIWRAIYNISQKPYIAQNTLEIVNNEYIQDDVLAFIDTKFNKLPKMELVELAEFYQKEEVGKAKEKLFKGQRNPS